MTRKTNHWHSYFDYDPPSLEELDRRGPAPSSEWAMIMEKGPWYKNDWINEYFYRLDGDISDVDRIEVISFDYTNYEFQRGVDGVGILGIIDVLRERHSEDLRSYGYRPAGLRPAAHFIKRHHKELLAHNSRQDDYRERDVLCIISPGARRRDRFISASFRFHESRGWYIYLGEDFCLSQFRGVPPDRYKFLAVEERKK